MKHGRLRKLIAELSDSQWLPTEELETFQFHQLKPLLAWHAHHTPYFRRKIRRAGLDIADLTSAEAFRALPVLKRDHLQQEKGTIAETIPDGHLPLRKSKSSGSTGIPVSVTRTGLTLTAYFAMTMREHQWHRSDFSLPFASIRANIPEIIREDSWGAPAALLHETGPLLGLPITMSAAEHFALLEAFRPGNLLAYPNSLAALIDYMKKEDLSLGPLNRLRTIGESVNAGLREKAREMFDCRLVDAYSATECGHLAIQCPDSPLYHVMAETILMEIVDEAGAPCAPGEIGRVLITDLLNYATPLIRYDIGDHAEAGEPCPCGRGLPTIRRIVGRDRNLILMPDGSRHWPVVGFAKFRDIAPVRQYQIVQHTPEDIEVRLFTERPVSPDEEARLGIHIQRSLGHAFRLRFTYFDDYLPRPASGKFEEFSSKV